MLALCKNGHVTGQRKCERCGSDRWEPFERDKPVSMNRRERRRVNAELDRHGTPNYDRSRRATRIGSGVQGPNKVDNVS